MNYTQNYQLNQWDVGDRVLREDFNEDNAKIDAAIAAVDAKIDETVQYVKIAEASLSTAASQLNLNVSNIDWSQYLKAELFAYAPGTGIGMTLRVNNLATGYYCVGLSMGSTGDASANYTYLASWVSCGNAAVGLVELPTPHPSASVTCFHAAAAASGSYASYSSGINIAPVTWANLKTFNLVGSLPAGTRFILCGVKA